MEMMIMNVPKWQQLINPYNDQYMNDFFHKITQSILSETQKGNKYIEIDIHENESKYFEKLNLYIFMFNQNDHIHLRMYSNGFSKIFIILKSNGKNNSNPKIPINDSVDISNLWMHVKHNLYIHQEHIEKKEKERYDEIKEIINSAINQNETNIDNIFIDNELNKYGTKLKKDFPSHDITNSLSFSIKNGFQIMTKISYVKQ